MLLIKRCKIQRSIYHAKTGSRGRGKTAQWESQEDSGMQRHAPHKHMAPHDFDLCTTSKTFQSCLNIVEDNPTTFLLVLQEIQLALLQLPGALIFLSLHSAAGLSKRRKCSQPLCTHRGGKAEPEPQLASLPNTPWGISLPQVSDQQFPLQIRLLNPQYKAAVRPMIYCSFHPVSLAMAPFCELLKTKEKVNHVAGFTSAKTPWKLQFVSWKGTGRGEVVTVTWCGISVLSTNTGGAAYTMFFSWFFTAFCASS